MMQYSKDGSLLALGNQNSILIFSTETNKLVSKLEHPAITAIAFSPANHYLLTWERLTNEKPDNMLIWDVQSGELIGKFTQKTFSNDTWLVIPPTALASI